MITIKQESKYIGHDRWEWSVWLEGKPEELAAVEGVVYTLHPTFPVPVVEVKNRKNGFRLDNGGWGEFEIYAEVRLKGGKRKKLEHYLTLQYPRGDAAAAKKAPSKEPVAPLVFVSSGLADASIAEALRKSLTEQGMRVVTSDDLSAGESWKKAVDSAFSEADVAAFIVSPHMGPFVSREIAAAVSKRVGKIVPVIVDPSAKIPPQLMDYEAVRVENPSDLSDVARRVGGLTSANFARSSASARGFTGLNAAPRAPLKK